MSAPVQTEQQIRDGASSQQHEASEPAASAFVMANAGTGKTHLLVGRVIRLMLDGVEPERILCLTYTRAAAAEMSTRLFETLSGFIAMDGEKLITTIHDKIGHAEFKPDQLDLARRLFTRALETPGGLKVQTIHAFCERLLQRFPVEAGIMPGFSVLDEPAERELLAQARREVLGNADAKLATQVATVLNYTSEMTFDRLLLELLGKRKGLLDSFGSDNAFSQLHDGLNARLGLTDSDTADDIRQDFLSTLDWSALDHAADALSASASTTDQSQAARIKEASNAASHEDRFAALQSVLLKADGDPKASKSLMTKKVGDAHPDIRPMLEDLQQSCLDACQQIRALAVRDATEALVAVALQVTRRFTSLKQRASAYDYADLIERTNELLTGSNQAAWVLYKLDQGLDHILIDEAQDTSLEQWRIINALTDEFFAGEGARDISGRTIFAVGDRKQSIYSFQGADPEVFDRQRDHYKQAVNGAHGKFISVELQTSFRSSCKVLEAVDLVFAHDDTKDGVTSTDQPDVRHIASRIRDEGIVEIWDIERQPRAESPDRWLPPETAGGAAQLPANVRLANAIARKIQGWLYVQPLEMLAPDRPVRPSDILILLRERSSLMEAIVRALKDHNVPVAGADRLHLLDHIAVQDLIALGRFVVLPEDDLNLASLLKSPLLLRDDGERFNDDDDIFHLANGRGNDTVWQSLQGASGCTHAVGKLRRWRDDAASTGVYRFYANVLSRDEGRAHILSAIGNEAGEPVDAFLQQCVEYERTNLSSIAGFLAWLEATSASLKRDMEQAAGEVRVMTVHGAKGLEAPIVFLPDTCTKPDGRKVAGVLFDEDADDLPVWRIKKEFSVDATRQLEEARKAAMQREHNRLLYVAMTRARDRLYVCGFLKSKKADGWENDEPEYGTWYHAIRRALVEEGLASTVDDEGRIVWRFGSGAITSTGKSDELVRETRDVDMPAWATSAVPAVDRPMRWLTPSGLGEADSSASRDGWSPEVALSPLAAAHDRRYRRGSLVHRLLQSLPDLPAEARESAARRYLARNGVTEPDLSATAGEVMALFADDRFAGVFASDARAEVSISAMLSPPGAARFGISGQIDRLLVTPDKVLIVDFKTNRPPPETVDQVPASYLRQLAAYAHVLHDIYPAHAIECALLWTDAPRLMPVPQSMLDTAWGERMFKTA